MINIASICILQALDCYRQVAALKQGQCNDCPLFG
jgi:hypothetical protein